MIIVHFSCQEREKKKTQTIDCQRQSNHDMSTCIAPCEREHIYHLVIWWITRFDHREVSHAPP
jgi:hypothetical protein